jgi:hypothetical protein
MYKKEITMKINKILLGAMLILISLSTFIIGAEALLLTDLGTSARMIGLGNIEGFDEGSNSIFENPAGLYRIKNISAGAFTTKLMHEVVYRNITLGMKTDWGTFAAGYMSADVSDIPHTYRRSDNRFDVSYYFRYETLLGKLGYQTSINENIHLGLAADYYATNLDTYSGRGWNMDGGVIVDFAPLELSLTARNILRFSKAKYTDGDDSEYEGEEKFPFQTVLSGKYNFYDFDVLGQVKTNAGRSRNLVALGLHYNPWILKVFHLYGGYKEYYGAVDVFHVQTLGVGLSLFGLSFDYAYENSDHFEYSTNHYFSFSMAF